MTAFLYSDKAAQHRRMILISLAVLVTYLIYSAGVYRASRIDLPVSTPNPDEIFHAPVLSSPDKFKKPKDKNIIGLVFFGRRNRVEILNCYLERNLVTHGGWLDEVHWVENTDRKDDLDYLHELIDSNPLYKKITLRQNGGFNNAWEMLQPGHLYVKIDDDVVWFADDAIARTVTMKHSNPDYLLVSANMINSPLMGWVHYRMGAIHPYLPEGQTFNTGSGSSWKYLDHPYYSEEIHHEPGKYDIMAKASGNHRWLRLQNDYSSYTSALALTPTVQAEYGTWGTSLKSWRIAAQHHYSFLENLHDDNLEIYKFKRAWIANYERTSINFIVVDADEILKHLPIPGDVVDEEWITVHLPRRLGKSVVFDSESLASHFTFFFQGDMDSTDLLARYKNYAEENICRYRNPTPSS